MMWYYLIGWCPRELNSVGRFKPLLPPKNWLDGEYLSNPTSGYRSLYPGYDYLVLFVYLVLQLWSWLLLKARVVNSKRRVVCDCDWY